MGVSHVPQPGQGAGRASAVEYRTLDKFEDRKCDQEQWGEGTRGPTRLNSVAEKHKSHIVTFSECWGD